MTTRLISGSVWGHLKQLSRLSNTTIAAVPYFGIGATELLTLRAGSVLVLKFDREAIGSGQVDPREVVKAVQCGVQIHHCSNLHAKVYVFDETAVVGSANVSHNSEHQLLEACVETNDSSAVESAKRFVRGLRGDRIGLDFAKKMIPYYRPPIRLRIVGPRSRRKKIIPTQSDMWLLSLVEGSWQDVDWKQQEKGLEAAITAIRNPRAFEVNDFLWSESKILSLLRVGQRIIRCTKTDIGKIFFSAPSRIIGIRRYRVKNRKRAIVYLESPRRHRRRQLAAVLKKLGSLAERLGNPRRSKRLRDPELVFELGRLWT